MLRPAPILALLTAVGALACGFGAGDVSELRGTWCADDPEVGCYTFSDGTVHEHENEIAHTKPADGTWRFDAETKLLIMEFGGDDWVLELHRYAPGEVLVVRDPAQDKVFTFAVEP